MNSVNCCCIKLESGGTLIDFEMRRPREYAIRGEGGLGKFEKDESMAGSTR